MRKTGLCFLIVLAACGGTKVKRKTTFAPGSETFRLDGVIAIEVLSVEVAGDRKIRAVLNVENTGKDDLRVFLNRVRLNYGGRKHTPRTVGPYFTLIETEIKAKTLSFHVDNPAPGEYDLVFSGFHTLGPGGWEPLSDKQLTVKLKVP